MFGPMPDTLVMPNGGSCVMLFMCCAFCPQLFLTWSQSQKRHEEISYSYQNTLFSVSSVCMPWDKQDNKVLPEEEQSVSDVFHRLQ